MKRLISILIIFLFSEKLSAQEVYVSVSGSDSNAGTIDSPFRTIQKASNTLVNGGTIYIRQGVYRETVNVAHRNQIFTNYENEDVIVTGLDKVTGWSPYKNGIYLANLGDFETQFTQVFVNGMYQQMARYPDNVSGNMLDVTFQSSYDDIEVFNGGGATRRVYFPNMPDVPDDYWKGGYFRGISGLTWINPHGVISRSTGNDLQVTPGVNSWAENSDVVDGTG